jgi:4-hydroxybenzoate polyprenyltransferase
VRWLPLLRLLRVGTLFSPAADVVASAAVAGVPWSGDVVRAAAASVCLYAAGMVWNDVADRRVDAVERPERPLVRGDLSPAFAVSLGVLLLGAGVLASPCPWYHALIAALVLVYDFASKRIGWFGAPLMGSLRALNLGTALALPAAPAGDATALVAAAACYGVYIACITVLGMFEDRPAPARAVIGVQAAAVLAPFAGVCVVQGTPWPAPVIALLPLLAFARRLVRVGVWDQRAIRRSMMFLLLGTMLYTALLALAAGHVVEALAIAAAIAPARWIARTIALT